ncbi:MAG TPA: hypothetical protein VKV02_05005 [Acidobacteriaceae bacterium]|nr:hypothetical protein [Acidobacteriaceae bacterium]
MPAMHAALTTPQAIVLGTQLVSTLTMFGLIWFVQLVHYPLFLRVPPEAFIAYETEHANRTGVLVFPFMLAELLSALALLIPKLRPATIPASQALIGAALVGVLWASTVFVQIPLHNRLHQAHNPATIRRLINSNWLRTAAWTARTTLLVTWTAHVCRP